MKDDISGVTEQVYLSLIFVNSKLFWVWINYRVTKLYVGNMFFSV